MVVTRVVCLVFISFKTAARRRGGGKPPPTSAAGGGFLLPSSKDTPSRGGPPPSSHGGGHAPQSDSDPFFDGDNFQTSSFSGSNPFKNSSTDDPFFS